MDELDLSRMASTALTMLFTDIEGSTSLWVEHPDEAGSAIGLHDEIVSGAISRHGGKVIKTTGDGFLAVFGLPRSGAEAAIDAQLALRSRADELLNAAQVRMALHAGTVEEREGDLFGLAVNKCQRLMAAASAGQILVSDAAAGVLRSDLPTEAGLTDLGDHRLRGIPGVTQVYQLVEPRLRRDFPALATSVGVPSNLPVELTSFIGREAELAEILDLMAEHRLVTLTGEGGAGKTRLALQAGANRLDQFDDGVWFVELESLRDPDLVGERIASTLGLAERAGRPYVELIEGHLRDKRTLLIVDNCEHLLAAAAHAVETLLRSLPRLHFLVTSRQRLGVPSEVTYRVPPLAVPDAGADPDTIAEHDAVRLFVDRAGLSRPGFSLTADNAGAVSRISRRLDGIPLAIELAAAKMAVLTPDQVVGHLDDRFKLLTQGDHSTLPRHQTLAAAIDWSHELLPRSERILLARLAVFRGGFDLAAAEAVCGGDGDSGSIVVMVSALVEKSLVVVDVEVARYRLLDTIRRYAADRLSEEGEGEDIAARHGEYFVALAETGGPRLEGPDQAAWLERFEQERDNLRAAIEWALDHEPRSLRLAASIWMFWLLRGRWTEGREWLDQAITSDAEGSDNLRAEALRGLGVLASSQGDQDAAQALLEEARELAESVGAVRIAASALANTAMIHHKEGDLSAATAALLDALGRARLASDASLTGYILANLALLLEDQGDHAAAVKSAREALTVSTSTEDPYLIADAMLTAGEIALNQDDRKGARRLLEDALAKGAEIGLDLISAWARSYLGKLALRNGDFQASRALLGEGLELFREMESAAGAEWALRHLALAELQSDEIQAARESADEAARLAQGYVRPDIPYVLQVSGRVVAADREFESAATLFAAVRHLGTEMDLRLPQPETEEVATAWAAVVAELSPEALAAAVRHGEEMTLDAAVTFARTALR